MKKKILNWIFSKYREEFYDFVVETFIGQVPDIDREPVLDWLADKKVLFERFLSIQAYYIQRARIYSKKSPDFYDGALMIIKAFLVAVNRKVQSRTPVVPGIDKATETQEELKKVSSFVGDFLKENK